MASLALAVADKGKQTPLKLETLAGVRGAVVETAAGSWGLLPHGKVRSSFVYFVFKMARDIPALRNWLPIKAMRGWWELCRSRDIGLVQRGGADPLLPART